MSATTAYLGLGANIGDARGMIERAVELIAALPRTRVTARSRDWRTPPWGKTDQDWFVNAVVAVETGLAPHDLLEACLSIERKLGRERRERWGPRLIDIDIIAYGDITLAEEKLTLPHRHALERAFVLAPLVEIAPRLVLSGVSVRTALEQIDRAGLEPLALVEEPAGEPEFDRTAQPAAGRLERLSPLIRRIVAPNPGPFTFTGTCTYVVGEGEVAVIDPGPADARHIDGLIEALGHERITHIIATHTHRDHTPGAALLKERTGAMLVGCGPHRPARPLRGSEDGVETGGDRHWRPERELIDGEIFEGRGFTLEAVHTPGHTTNHLAFALKEENALFCGDHVMAWSTTVVMPPDGSMRDFMLSLERLKGRDESVFWPGHGGPVTAPRRFVRALIAHRRMREHAILLRVEAGDETIAAMVERIYEGLDPRLKPAAGLSVYAHLEDLVGRGLVATDGDPEPDGRYRMR